jgi:5-methylcytosine-specific restriction endonuclease McrA
MIADGTLTRMPTVDPRYQSPAWRRLSRAIIERDGAVCQIRDRGCTQWATSADHIEAVVNGGAFWDPANLRAACRHCNSANGARVAAARAARYRTGVAAYETRW